MCVYEYVCVILYKSRAYEWANLVSFSWRLFLLYVFMHQVGRSFAQGCAVCIRNVVVPCNVLAVGRSRVNSTRMPSLPAVYACVRVVE